jgi:hypothetical protein
MLVLCATVKLTPVPVPVPVPVIDTGTAPVQHRYITYLTGKAEKSQNATVFPVFVDHARNATSRIARATFKRSREHFAKLDSKRSQHASTYTGFAVHYAQYI